MKYVDHVLSAERVYWLKRIGIKEEHEPVVIGLGRKWSTAPILTLPARLRACEIKLYLKVNKLRNKIYTMMKKNNIKKTHTHTHVHMHARTLKVRTKPDSNSH